ncbi:MAG: hypothetical protein M1834_004654 [Cirrosporium novae-zelandiae]|nr:MAG: hypothetical protein M1834_004654 [Cirrosporium novae-zelandiae]
MNSPRSIFTDSKSINSQDCADINSFQNTVLRSSSHQPSRKRPRRASAVGLPESQQNPIFCLESRHFPHSTGCIDDRRAFQRIDHDESSRISLPQTPSPRQTIEGPEKKRPRSETFEKPSNPLNTNSARRSHQRITLRHSLDLSAFRQGPVDNKEPPSPLFFSHTSRTKPMLPARYSGSEAGATMLSKAQGGEDPGGIKTVRLPRGTHPSTSSPRSLQGSSGRRSSARSSFSITSTPDGLHPMSKGTGSAVLSQIGAIELLECDERPIFVVDLSNSVSYLQDTLSVLFANAAFRGRTEVVDAICGKFTTDTPELTAFTDFKTWVLNLAKNHVPMSSILPTFHFAGVTWTASTLRKRFRVISGNHGSPNVTFRSPSGLTTLSPHPNYQENEENIGKFRYDEVIAEEPADYFGDAPVPQSASTTPPGSCRPMTDLEKDGSVDCQAPRDVFNPMEPDQFVRYLAPSPTLPEPPLFDEANSSVVGQLRIEYLESGAVSPTLSDTPLSGSGFYDWTRLPPSESLPPHIQFAKSRNWAATSLGPMEEWSNALRGTCNMIMASPHPAAMYWGDDLIAIYNEAYTLLAGNKHPKLMGQSYMEAWSEIWDEVKEVFSSARTTGQATMKDDDCLFVTRNGFLEETYFSWSIIPLVGDDGSVVGIYNPAFEKTRRKVAERRMLTLREVGEKTASARELKGFWVQVLRGLEYNARDAPFALLYSVSDDMDSDTSSIHSSSMLGTKQCILEGSLGVPDGHPAAVAQIDLKTGMEGFATSFRESMKTDRPTLLQIQDGSLQAELLDGIEWRGFGDPCTSVVVCPIHPTTGESVLGFLVMGINPRRPYDDDYQLFIQLLSRQLATSLASVVLFEEEIKRGQQAAKLAALDRIELSQQLAARTQEAELSERKFTRMAEYAPVGMFIANSDGRIIYCNDMWYDITGHPRDDQSVENWMESVQEEDKPKLEESWRNVIENKIPVTMECRFRTPWKDHHGHEGDTWVLTAAYPEIGKDGHLLSVFGSMTNISQQKWAEDFVKRRLEEAVELKRQQENFIDITSHEMRNPLSAVLQCADEITSSLIEFKAENSRIRLNFESVESAIDSAQTITLCAQHQKRIVDDVLTLSKLDSALLLVTPVDVQPVAVVQRALKMFEGELQNADIRLKFHVDEGYHALKVDWVRLDPSRLLQVLINLTTNAIKFTSAQEQRTIIVSLDAFRQPPSKMENAMVRYFPSRSKRAGSFDGSDWGDGEEIFLHFSVQDTGRGLSDNEKKMLFMRFSQASPRTHVQYGGSGLGLFISRELVELQGGEIGVTSEAGKGSTFAFYIKAKKTRTPLQGLADCLPPNNTNTNNNNNNSRKISIPHNNEIKSPLSLTRHPSISTTPSNYPQKCGQGLTILVVEDNLVNQRVLQKQLRKLGCEVYVANHGGEALDKLEMSRYWRGNEEKGLDLGVILMDLEMPVMDGLTCARKIRSLQKDGTLVGHVPIIAVTANARSGQIQTAMEAGMDDVVSKPFRIPDLIPKIEELMAQSNDNNNDPIFNSQVESSSPVSMSMPL